MRIICILKDYVILKSFNDSLLYIFFIIIEIVFLKLVTGQFNISNTISIQTMIKIQ